MISTQVTTDALSTQVGGCHYKNKPVQPIEFAMKHKLDACAFSTLKYVTRHAEKDGERDLRKAYHFVQLREALVPRPSWLRRRFLRSKLPTLRLAMTAYCTANRLPSRERMVLLTLADFVRTGDKVYADMLKAQLSLLIQQTYSTKE